MAKRESARVRRLVNKLREGMESTYPELQYEPHNGGIHVVGPFRLLEGAVEVDRFDVEIVVGLHYPRTVPDVYEIGGRIPRTAHRHMYLDGRACLFVVGERWRYWPKGSSFRDFLDGPVRAFFIGQSFYELTGDWPLGQRSHGAPGIMEAYSEMLRTRDLPTIIRYLEVLSRRKLRPYLECPCGKGRPIHGCHIRQLAELRAKVPYREAASAKAILLQSVQHRQPKR